MKVVVIGAGAAGLTAGRLLRERGIDVEILEASATHGGRVRGLTDFVDVPIDVGAEWVHHWVKARPPSLRRLFAGEDPDHPTFPYRPQTVAIVRRGKLRRLDWLRFLAANDHKFVDSSWAQVIGGGVTPDDAARIRFDSVVERVEYGESGVSVTTASGAVIEADKVIVTIPIRMLQLGSIAFVPPLPQTKMRAIHNEVMPGGLKVFIEFSECFYPHLLEMGPLWGRGSDGDCSYYDAMLGKPTDRHVLGLFTQGEKAERYLQQGSDEAIADYVLAELDDLFDGAATRHHLQHVVQNWSAEPFIQGSYSKRAASAKELAASVADRVYFAGEAMNPSGQTIAVQGAVESSYVAVAEMLVEAAPEPPRRTPGTFLSRAGRFVRPR
ncbi:MAG: NAD(P)/FAD-dependent oxidoreductase [Actinomycetota bacterium]